MLRVAASRVPSLALRLREGSHYFQAGAHLLWGRVGKRYYTGLAQVVEHWTFELVIIFSSTDNQVEPTGGNIFFAVHYGEKLLTYSSTR